MRHRFLPASAILVVAVLVAPSSALQFTPLRRPDVIFVPTPQNVVDAMLELASAIESDS